MFYKLFNSNIYSVMRKLTEGSLLYDSYKWCLKIRRRKWNGFFSHQLNNRVGWHFSWIIKQHFRVNNAAWEADLSCNIKPIVVVVFYRPYIMPILSRTMPRKVLPDVATNTQFFSMEVWTVGLNLSAKWQLMPYFQISSTLNRSTPSPEFSVWD